MMKQMIEINVKEHNEIRKSINIKKDEVDVNFIKNKRLETIQKNLKKAEEPKDQSMSLEADMEEPGTDRGL
jgi:hypothetical protein